LREAHVPGLKSLAWQPPPPWALTLFRLVCGLGLALYFLNHYLTTIDLIAYHGLYDADAMRALGVPVRNVGWLTERSPVELRVLFLCAMALAVLGGAGVFPRAISAVLFVVALSSYRAVLPISHLDDYLATVTAFWLVLLPGPDGSLLTKGYWRCETTRYGLSDIAFVFVGYTLLLYLVLGLGLLQAGSPSLAPRSVHLVVLGCCLIPAFAVAPGRWSKLTGAVLQILLHGYLAATTELVVTHLLLCATGLVLWTPGLVRHRNLAPAPPLRMTFPVAAGATYAVLLALVQLGAPVLPAGTRLHMARLLLDAGLLPALSSEHPLPAKVGFVLQVPTSAEVIVPSDNVRLSLLLQRVAASTDPQSRDDALVKRLLRASCARDHVTGSGVAAIVSDGAVRKRWSFTCYSVSELPTTLLLERASSASPASRG
jgi:hypothetical protein